MGQTPTYTNQLQLIDKFIELAVQNQTTLNKLTQDLNEIKDLIGKSDATLFVLLHKLVANKEKIEEVHKKILEFIEKYSKREYTEAEVEEIGGYVKEIHELAKSLEETQQLECTDKIIETHEFIKGIKRRWKLFVALITGSALLITFAEKIIKLIIYLHTLLGGV